jgi:hypothetical protein
MTTNSEVARVLQEAPGREVRHQGCTHHGGVSLRHVLPARVHVPRRACCVDERLAHEHEADPPRPDKV